MSDLNVNWLKSNFEEETFVFFDVGCMNMDDSIKVKQAMPKAKVYAFECSNEWWTNNTHRAIEHGIYYFHTAVCHVDGMIPFNPSLTQHGRHHPDSGSIFVVNPQDNHGKVYGEPYEAKSVRLETFCKRYNVMPDFVHIDVEGAELKVFENVGDCKPKCVWAEVVTFEHYLTGTNRNEFDQLMSNIGYNKIFDGSRDSLYCLKGFDVTPY
jgi:FkbM family methyltransferase